MASPLGPGGMPPGQISIVKLVLGGSQEYKGVRLPGLCTPEVMAGVESMEIREDDVILATYPKCGKLRKDMFACRCTGPVSIEGAEVSCPHIFSIACPNVKWFCPNITCVFEKF